MNSDILSRFYLSAVTPLGFVSRLCSLCDPEKFDRVILLKGGSPALRSGLLADAAEQAKQRGFAVSTVLSALEQGEPEAVFWNSTAVIDSATPYCIEPRLPSAFEDILWLGGCYDKALRQHRGEIAALDDSEAKAFESGRKLLFAADELLKDSSRAAACCIDTEKVRRQALRAAKKYLAPSNGSEMIYISRGRANSCRHIDLPPGFSLTLLQDRQRGFAQMFLKQLYSEAKRLRCPMTVLYSPLAPYSVIDLLLLPDSGFCFAVESEQLCFSRPADSVIHSRRFTEKQALSRITPHLRQDQKSARQLMQRSDRLFEDSLHFRHKKEEIYNYFLDIAKFDQIRHTFFANIFQDP